MAAPYTYFHEVDIAKFKLSQATLNQNGKGKTVWVNVPRGEPNKFCTPRDIRQKWNIRPGSDDATKGELKEHEKFNLEIELTPNEFEVFAKKATDFDSWVINEAFGKKKEWFGRHADEYESATALRPLQSRVVKRGTESPEGVRQPDSIRFKIDGWAPYFDSAIMDEKRTSMIKDCVWKDRIASDPSSAPRENRDTRFYLHIGKDQLNDKDLQTEKVPVIDAAGAPRKDSSGNIIQRQVGPQDCKANSRLTIVFTITKVYISDNKFGTTLTAKEVYVKPAAAKVKNRLEGVEIVKTIDPQSAAKAVQAVVVADSDVDSDAEDNLSAHEAHDAEDHTSGADGSAPAPVESKEPAENLKKRKRDDAKPDANVSPKKKSSKKEDSKPKSIVVDEDF